MTSAEISTTEAGSLAPLALRRAWLSIDQNPRAIEFVSGLAGTLAIHAAFIVVVALSFQVSKSALVLIGLTLFAIALMPAQRISIIVGSSLFYLAMRPFRIDGWSELLVLKARALPFNLPPLALQVGAVGAFLVLVAGFMFWQRGHMETKMAKRPVLSLMLLWSGLLCAAWAMPTDTLASSVLWAVTGVAISCFWFLAYAATDQKSKDTTPTLARVGLMRPFWGGSAAPIGKSFGYLNKFDAKNCEELATTRLKGLKLAVWALMLSGLMHAMQFGLYEQLGVPQLQSAILAHSAGETLGQSLNWAGLVANYFLDLVIIAVWGHFIVAAIRMTGYRIPRNTRNPLASRSLAEFWNRYFFYFKELLVDFFFYPAFVRYFKKNPKLRVAFATFCAAAVGNFLYHFTRETYVFATLSLTEALPIFQSAVFYSLALATGLIVSQWRGAKPKPEDGVLRYEVLPRLNVFAFFCFLKIFDDISGEGTLVDRGIFTLSLFGL